MGTKSMLSLRRALAVLVKDLRLEFRSRYAYSAIVMFAVTTLVTISFSLGVGLTDVNVAAALLWIIIFFSSMTGISRSFVYEEESGTMQALKMAADPKPAFLGKYLFNAVLLISLTFVIVPLFVIMAGLSVVWLGYFLATVFLGVMGLVGTGTILSAIAAQSSAKGSLMTVLAFPLTAPLLISSISATRLSFEGVSKYSLMTELMVLFCFNGVVLAASMLLFEHIWNE